MYKCRLCGVTYSDSGTSTENAFPSLSNAIHDRVTHAQAPEMLSFHSCANNGTDKTGSCGVSDFIGFVHD